MYIRNQDRRTPGPAGAGTDGRRGRTDVPAVREHRRTHAPAPRSPCRMQAAPRAHSSLVRRPCPVHANPRAARGHSFLTGRLPLTPFGVRISPLPVVAAGYVVGRMPSTPLRTHTKKCGASRGARLRASRGRGPQKHSTAAPAPLTPTPPVRAPTAPRCCVCVCACRSLIWA